MNEDNKINQENLLENEENQENTQIINENETVETPVSTTETIEINETETETETETNEIQNNTTNDSFTILIDGQEKSYLIESYKEMKTMNLFLYLILIAIVLMFVLSKFYYFAKSIFRVRL